MKILRSQYLKLQNGSDVCGMSPSNNEGMGNLIVNKGVGHVNSNEPFGVSEGCMLLQRRESITCFKTRSNPNAANINILFESVDTSLKKLNLVLEYTNMSSAWLTNIYKTYENDLWRKKPRLDRNGNKKWNYYCGLCANVYKAFGSTKNHLNSHLNYFPYVCKMCLKKYTGRQSAIRHLKKIHHINRQQFNEFLIS